MSAPAKTSAPNVNRLTFRDLEAQARKRVPGLQNVDFSRCDPEFAQLLVNRLEANCLRNAVRCQNIAPLSWPGWRAAVPGNSEMPPIGAAATFTIGIAYDPGLVGPGLLAKTRRLYRNQSASWRGDPNRSLEYIVEHETRGHAPMLWATETTGPRVRRAWDLILAKWAALGAAKVGQLLGTTAVRLQVPPGGKPKDALPVEFYPEAVALYSLAPNRVPLVLKAWVEEIVETLEGRRGY